MPEMASGHIHSEHSLLRSVWRQSAPSTTFRRTKFSRWAMWVSTLLNWVTW